MKTFAETHTGYLNMWKAAKLLPAHHAEAVSWAQKISDGVHRPVFQQVQDLTGVPWYVVGCLMYREPNEPLDLRAYLGNGEALSQVTTLVPAGRGPFKGPTAFLDGAVDALSHEGMTGIALADWTIDRILYWCERFNGQGYFAPGRGNSPYLWSWTDQYHGGKFTSDGHYDASEWDAQGGVAALLMALAEINTDIAKAITPPTAPAPITQETPMATTTTAVAPATATTFHLPHIDFAMLEKFVESGAVGLGVIGMIYPPAKNIIPFIPVVEGFLTGADKIEAAVEGGGNLKAVLAGVLRDVADQLDAPVVVTAAAASSMPNS